MKLCLKDLKFPLAAALLLSVSICGIWSLSILHAEENASFAVTLSENEFTAGSERAMLCFSCALGAKKENCVKCGKWISSSPTPAILCGFCGHGSNKENCVKCGIWVGSGGHPASLCFNCAYVGNRKDTCVKCGKLTGTEYLSQNIK